MTDQHPTVPSWTPEPPPARRRRLGPGLLAAAIAVLLLFGGVGLVAARQSASTAQGASSPEAAGVWEDALSRLAVRRGDHAMPVGDPLPVVLPDQARRIGAPGQGPLGG